MSKQNISLHNSSLKKVVVVLLEPPPHPVIVSASLTRGGVALATNDEDSNVVSGDNGGGAVIVPLRVPAVNDDNADGGGSVGHVLRVIGRFAGEAGTVFKVREGRTLLVCFGCFDDRELNPLSPLPNINFNLGYYRESYFLKRLSRPSRGSMAICSQFYPFED